MDLKELLNQKPRDYLRNGFFTSDGELREGINGEQSLAMAYRLREESIHPELLKKIISNILHLLEPLKEGLDSPEKIIPPDVHAAFMKFPIDPQIQNSPALLELFSAASPWLKNLRDLSAFIMHLQRIQTQLALILATKPSM